LFYLPGSELEAVRYAACRTERRRRHNPVQTLRRDGLEYESRYRRHLATPLRCGTRRPIPLQLSGGAVRPVCRLDELARRDAAVTACTLEVSPCFPSWIRKTPLFTTFAAPPPAHRDLSRLRPRCFCNVRRATSSAGRRTRAWG